MADDAEDVLELDDALEIKGEDQEPQTDGDAEEDGDEEIVVGFDGEEAAPASESESSVIRELRQANREKDRELARLRKQSAPQIVDPGPEPTLEACDYDEDRFKDQWRAWNAASAEAAQQNQAEEAQRRASQEAYAKRVDAYRDDKAALKRPDFEDAEGEVFTALPEQHFALLMEAKEPAKLVYALAKSPAKLAELSKLSLVRAAMMVGKLEDQVKVTTRKPPAPDTALRGNAPLSAGRPDKELERLEKESERTGDRTAVIRYKRQLRERA